MSLLSRRFVLAIAGLLGVTAILVAILTVRPHRFDPCAHPQTLSVTSLIPGAKHLETKELGPDSRYLMRTEGTFSNPISRKAPFEYEIVRSFDVLNMALRPVTLVAPQIDAEHHRLESIDVDGTSIPVHIVEDFTKQPPQLIAYIQAYGLTPSSNPMASHLLNFLGVLRHGTPAVTTVIVNGPITRAGQPEAEESALRWLGDSWKFIERFCAPPAKDSGRTP
ncbi:MAG: hypothetical protein GY937_21035 [bacterium]|nr:hypothetical protein [bacterium]